ncbi:hypothetical protein B0H13DRAFT_1934081 [Mycena leptocephala]|nr:hypothetical protein B0H13DRAFT_1934081 [Mycena leptocephala]
MASGGDGGGVHDEKRMPQQLQPAGWAQAHASSSGGETGARMLTGPGDSMEEPHRAPGSADAGAAHALSIAGRTIGVHGGVSFERRVALRKTRSWSAGRGRRRLERREPLARHVSMWVRDGVKDATLQSGNRVGAMAENDVFLLLEVGRTFGFQQHVCTNWPHPNMEKNLNVEGQRERDRGEGQAGAQHSASTRRGKDVQRVRCKRREYIGVTRVESPPSLREKILSQGLALSSGGQGSGVVEGVVRRASKSDVAALIAAAPVSAARPERTGARALGKRWQKAVSGACGREGCSQIRWKGADGGGHLNRRGGAFCEMRGNPHAVYSHARSVALVLDGDSRRVQRDHRKRGMGKRTKDKGRRTTTRLCRCGLRVARGNKRELDRRGWAERAGK